MSRTSESTASGSLSSLTEAEEQIVQCEAELVALVERLGALHARNFLAQVVNESRWLL